MYRKYEELEFTHFVVITSEGSVFGSARYDGQVYNFIIRREDVRTQQGLHWHELEPEIAHIVRKKAQDAYGNRPVYRAKRVIY